MQYEKSAPFVGDAREAFALAKAALTQSGYRLERVSQDELWARNHGGFVRTHSASPLLGASPVHLRIAAGRVELGADFEGVTQTRRFLVRLLVGLGLGLGGGLAAVFAFVFSDRWPAFIALGLGLGIPLVQLPIHLGVTVPLVRRRATAALDTLLHNLVHGVG